MSIGKIHKAGRCDQTRLCPYPARLAKTGPYRAKISRKPGALRLFSYNKACRAGKNINFDTIGSGNPPKMEKEKKAVHIDERMGSERKKLA